MSARVDSESREYAFPQYMELTGPKYTIHETSMCVSLRWSTDNEVDHGLG